MLYDSLTKFIRQYFYITSYERLKNETTGSVLERFSVKHPLLKPELIVQNDQPFGFKSIPKEYLSLENYPIFCEIQSIILEENSCRYVELCDIYAEIQLPENHMHRKAIIELSRIYGKSLSVEEIKELNGLNLPYLSVSSRIQDALLEMINMDIDEEQMSDYEIVAMFEHYFMHFNHFIKAIDPILNKTASPVLPVKKSMTT